MLTNKSIILRSFFTGLLGFVMAIVFAGAFLSFKAGGTGRLFEISKNLEIFHNLFKEVNMLYVDEVDPGKLMKTGVDAMLETLDPYTNYISESQIERYRFQQDGKYHGIGTTINKINGIFTIIEPHEGSPAFEAGLRAGDKLLKVNGQSLDGLEIEDLGTVLRGAANTAVTLTVLRPGEKKETEIQVIRSDIEIPNVPHSELVDDGIAYVNLTTFTANAGKNVSKAIKDLKKQSEGLKGIILDLRDNGGGLLREAVLLSNLFIPKEKDVVFTRGKVKEWDQTFKTPTNPEYEDVPLIVLINNRSASASEIVSGVIQDYDRGVLIGQRSYGKGLVQNTKEIGYNSRVKITTSKYYIPSGRCIQSVSYKDGEPVDIPDSLRSVFKTRAGRRVLDGGGVTPDIVMDAPGVSPFTAYMRDEFFVFSFVTDYLLKNMQEIDPVTFRFTDYGQFSQHILKQNPPYRSASAKLFADLKTSLEKERYTSSTESEIKALEKKLQKTLELELEQNRHELVKEIEREIITRAHYQKGKIRYNLKEDPEVKAAVQLFKEQEKYSKLLRV